MATQTPVDYDPFASTQAQAPSDATFTPVDHDPFAAKHDWSKIGLNEPQALNYINSLPPEQQQEARNEWGDQVVNKVWNEHPETNTADEAAGRFSEYLPGIGSWLPRLAGAYRYASGHSYEMGKALEQARLRKIEEQPSTKLFETPFGDVYTSGLEKAAGAFAGSAVMPMGRVFQGETFLPRAANMGANTAAYGALEGAGEGEDTAERLGNAGTGALVGGVTGPLLSEGIGAGLRTAGAMRRYAGRTLEEAHNPQLGADRQLNAAIKESGTAPEDLSKQVVPDISKPLLKKGMTQHDVADMVQRGLSGESAADIAKDYPQLTPSTITRYVNLYKAQNPTALNMMDLTDMAVGPGASLPMTRAGRSAFIISRDGPSAEKIINRQIEQPGRVADIVQQSGGGKNFDQRLQELQGPLKREEDAAYAAAKKVKAPVDLDPVLQKYRAEFPATGEAHNDTMNKAVDLFYSEGYVPTTPTQLQQAQHNLAVRQLDRSAAKALAKGDMDLHDALIDKRDALVDQFNNSTRHSVTGPVSDVDSFLKQRHKLDDMITASKAKADTGPGQKNTNLTRDLMGLRTDLNAEFAAKNPAYAAADAKFSGNRTAERLLNQGADMALKMKANRYLQRDFNKLTPSQQELVRVGFERNLAERALDKTEGAAAANQFQTDAFKHIVDTLYPDASKIKKAPKGAKQIYQRGQALVQNLRREAATTRTKSNIFANSNTAQTSFDIQDAMRSAYTAAHAATGDIGGVLHDVQKWAARQIGQRQATSLIRTLSETDPAKMLDHLERLGRVARNDNEAEIYRNLMRATRRKLLERAIVGGEDLGQRSEP